MSVTAEHLIWLGLTPPEISETNKKNTENISQIINVAREVGAGAEISREKGALLLYLTTKMRPDGAADISLIVKNILEDKITEELQVSLGYDYLSQSCRNGFSQLNLADFQTYCGILVAVSETDFDAKMTRKRKRYSVDDFLENDEERSQLKEKMPISNHTRSIEAETKTNFFSSCLKRGNQVLFQNLREHSRLTIACVISAVLVHHLYDHECYKNEKFSRFRMVCLSNIFAVSSSQIVYDKVDSWLASNETKFGVFTQGIRSLFSFFAQCLIALFVVIHCSNKYSEMNSQVRTDWQNTSFENNSWTQFEKIFIEKNDFADLRNDHNELATTVEQLSALVRDLQRELASLRQGNQEKTETRGIEDEEEEDDDDGGFVIRETVVETETKVLLKKENVPPPAVEEHQDLVTEEGREENVEQEDEEEEYDPFENMNVEESTIFEYVPSTKMGAAPAAEPAPAAAPAAYEEDEEKKKVVEERLKAYNEKKSKKPGPIAKSSVILDVNPRDDETDLAEMEKLVRSIELDGLVWGGAKLIPIGYRIKKLQISSVIEDLKVSVDDLIEKITGDFKGHVQSVDIVAFNKI